MVAQLGVAWSSFHRVYTPHAALRPVVTAPPPAPVKTSPSSSKKQQRRASPRLDWAALHQHSFSIDVFRCPLRWPSPRHRRALRPRTAAEERLLARRLPLSTAQPSPPRALARPLLTAGHRRPIRSSSRVDTRPLIPFQLCFSSFHSFGFQFHLELTGDMFGHWLAGAKDELAATGIDVTELCHTSASCVAPRPRTAPSSSASPITLLASPDPDRACGFRIIMFPSGSARRSV